MMEGHWSKEIHAIAYLVYAYLQKGDNAKAMEQYEYLKTMNIVSPDWDHHAAAYPFAAIPARIVLENKRWTEAANLTLHASNIQWDQFPWEKAIIHFAKILGNAHTGELQTAEKELAILQSLHQQLVDQEDQYKADQVMIQLKASQAWIQAAKGKNEEALTLMQEAANLEDNTEKHPVTPGEVLPAKELLGDLLLSMNRPSQALVAYELNLKRNPNRFNGIYGAAVAAKEVGDEEKARMHFESLLKLTESAISNRPEIEEAKAFVGQTES